MRSLHEAGEAVGTYSPAEELFNRRRRNVGLIGGPLALLILLAARIPIDAPAHRPLEPALGATFGASMGFMMPVSSPPNAIVYSSGHVPITAMIRHGITLDIAGFILIVLVVSSLGWLI
jgi:solute carrier family 13 (sodium-dependent dicarboxylate transporter), member 2/3/5